MADKEKKRERKIQYLKKGYHLVKECLDSGMGAWRGRGEGSGPPISLVEKTLSPPPQKKKN